MDRTNIILLIILAASIVLPYLGIGGVEDVNDVWFRP